MNNNTFLTTLVTIGDWIRYATTRFNAAELFFGHGYESAWDEAVHLVLATLHLPQDVNPQVFACSLVMDERKELLALIERRAHTRIPLAYILHEAWFCGLSFYVDQRVIVPRSPLGELIHKQFSPWIPDPEQVRNILDIGTGSGCIAIAAAMAFPEAAITAIDINEQALAVAAHNVERYQLEQQVILHQGDCFSGLTDQRYDVILSNPPYVSSAELANLPAEYHHEPRIALHAEEEGLAIVARIIAQAAKYLTADGILIVEVGFSQSAMMARFPQLPLTWLEFMQGGQGVFLLTAEQLHSNF